MKKLNVFKLLTVGLLSIFVILSCFSMNTFAATAYGTETTVRVNGYSYTYSSSVHNNSTSTWAYGRVASNQSNVATGYFGINSRLYNSSGTLVKSSGWQYNSSSIASKSLSSGSYSGTGTFYAQGQMSFYNGNGYNTYTSKASPRIQRLSVPVSEEYEVNENGLTYGSGYYIESPEEAPDLIRAIGVNGVEGYVYSDDLNLKLNTLDEVLEYMDVGQPDYNVKVYGEDGITVVDTFEIVTEEDMIIEY